MTYGAALPRIKPRPTLDNLQKPLVPLGTRPSPTSNVLTDSQGIRPSSSKTYSNPTSATHNVKTDAFGYPSSRVDNNTNYQRDRMPSIYLEPASPGATSNNLNPPTSKDKDKNAKPKHKLHLNLGLLGRSKQNQKAEPARLRDVTEIRVSNPTFTRENLSQRNYDAFFESGEPVYSLERRAPPKPTPEPEPPPSSAIDHRPHSLGFFNKSKASVTFRSKSADVAESVEVPQKGDRCPSQIFGLL